MVFPPASPLYLFGNSSANDGLDACLPVSDQLLLFFESPSFHDGQHSTTFFRVIWLWFHVLWIPLGRYTQFAHCVCLTYVLRIFAERSRNKYNCFYLVLCIVFKKLSPENGKLLIWTKTTHFRRIYFQTTYIVKNWRACFQNYEIHFWNRTQTIESEKWKLSPLDQSWEKIN